MTGAYKILPHYTYADYLKWEGKWELIEGIPYAMSPLPGVRHQHVSGNLYTMLRQALKNSCCNCKAFLPLDFKIAEDTVLQPDVLVVCDPQMNVKNLEKPPVLVAEVLSPSTALKDRNTKYYLYQSAGVAYYLIVDLENPAVELYHLVEGKYQMVALNPAQPFSLAFNECTIQLVFDEVWE